MNNKLLDASQPYLPYWFPRWTRLFERFIRTKIFKHKRYLIDIWTIEQARVLEQQHGLDVEYELATILQEEIEKEIKENGSQTWKEFCEKSDKD